jgi:2,3-bisphosphoglycerate-independent phosphoglycerate mutase
MKTDPISSSMSSANSWIFSLLAIRPHLKRKEWRMSPDYSPRGADSLARTVRELYAEGQTDYSLEPIVLIDGQGKPVGRVVDGDAVIFCCRRGEREIQLTEAFTEARFDRFPRPSYENLTFVTLTLYHDKFKDLPIAFAPGQAKDALGEMVSRAGLSQLHIAESEKFAHNTFFLNGGNNRPFIGEDDVCIPSPKGIPYDQVPELSLVQVARQVKEGIERQYDLIVANFANGDVLGHTSNNNAKIKCAECVDANLGTVMQNAQAADYVVLITADHGNLEEMTQPNGSPHVSHTNNLVPFFLLDPRAASPIQVRDGKLADIAPTILSLLDIKKPASMEGVNLALEHDWGNRRRVLLIILDGWGIGKNDNTNPIFLARTPVWDELTRRYPHSRLRASGEAVGLQPGKAGNSEAGHMNIGAGNVILQDDVRLDLAMQDGSFYTNETFCRVIRDVQQRGARLHLIGLLTEKSSHGSIQYPLALLKMAKEACLENVYLHIIFDGRSTEPGSAPVLLKELENQINDIGLGLVVSGVGRGIALDRDGNYSKTQRAYEALTLGLGKPYRLCDGESSLESEFHT